MTEISAEERKKARDAIEAARQKLHALCQGERFRMSVPVQPDDTDEVIGRGLDAGRDALVALEAVEARVEDVYKSCLPAAGDDPDTFEKWESRRDYIRSKLGQLLLDLRPSG